MVVVLRTAFAVHSLKHYLLHNGNERKIRITQG